MSDLVSHKIETAIEYNLKWLDLSGFGLESIPKSVLTILGLEVLILNDNNISDLSLLSNMPTLKSLWLEKNEIRSLDAVLDLPELIGIRANRNSIQSIRFIKKTPNLESLVLSGNPLVEIEGLLNLENLKELELIGCHIKDCRFLEDRLNLEILKIGSNQIRSLNNIENLPHLKDLQIDENRIESLAPLENLTLLKRLIARHNRISELSYIKNLQNLEVLDLKDNRIEKIDDVSTLRNLIELNLDDNNIQEASTLSGLTELNVLSLKNNNIKSTNFLEKLTGLISLDLSNNQINKLDNFWNLTNLQTLNISHNNLETIRPLEELVRNILEREDKDVLIDINNNKIISLKPLIPLIRLGIGLRWNQGDGWGIFCYENPWREPNKETMKKGRSAILEGEVEANFMILHSNDDQHYFDDLVKLLKILNRSFRVKYLHIESGFGDIEINSKKYIDEADFVLILISTSFLTEDLRWELAQYANCQKKMIIPIPIKKTDLIKGFPYNLQPLIDWNTPIASSSDKDDLWSEISTKIRKLIERHIQTQVS